MVRLLLRYIFSKFQKSPHHLCVEFVDGSKWQNYQNGEPEILIRFKTAHAEWYSLVFFGGVRPFARRLGHRAEGRHRVAFQKAALTAFLASGISAVIAQRSKSPGTTISVALVAQRLVQREFHPSASARR
jgi:hypothetical protein